MSKMIFVNLPVSNLDNAIAFYTTMGGNQNKQFSDGSAAMISFSEAINVMLLTHERFSGFVPGKAIADSRATCEVMLCLSGESREDVDATIERAGPAGGRIDPCPAQDHGFMYCRSFEDPDGHIWEVAWMDVEAATQAHDAEPATA